MVRYNYWSNFPWCRFSFPFYPLIAKGEENTSGAQARDPHNPTPPLGHGILLVLPPCQRHLRRHVPHREAEPEQREPQRRQRQAQRRLGPLVEPLDRRRAVAERVQGGRWRHGEVVVVAAEGDEGVAGGGWRGGGVDGDDDVVGGGEEGGGEVGVRHWPVGRRDTYKYTQCRVGSDPRRSERRKREKGERNQRE